MRTRYATSLTGIATSDFEEGLATHMLAAAV